MDHDVAATLDTNYVARRQITYWRPSIRRRPDNSQRLSIHIPIIGKTTRHVTTWERTCG